VEFYCKVADFLTSCALILWIFISST